MIFQWGGQDPLPPPTSGSAHAPSLSAGQLGWIFFNRSGRNISFVPGDSITFSRGTEVHVVYRAKTQTERYMAGFLNTDSQNCAGCETTVELHFAEKCILYAAYFHSAEIVNFPLINQYKRVFWSSKEPTNVKDPFY